MDCKFTPDCSADGVKNLVSFPEHMLIIGRTNSGKSCLVGDILSNIDKIYQRYTKDNIIIMLSPHDTIEKNFLRRFNSAQDWKILHFSMQTFDEESMESVLKYMDEENIIGREVFLFVDDLAIGGRISKQADSFILKAFATFRHKNISLIVTIQVCGKEFRPVMENSGLVVIMKHFGYHKCLEMILRNFVTSIKIPALLRSISPFLENKDNVGDHIVLNFSRRSMRNELYFITDTIFEPQYGYKRKSVERMCLDL